jgi:5-methyltetrahydropteroyltriglutamate--homocysteine methyltransferase
VAGVNAHVTLHVCYGNRYGKPSFEGSYQFLFPAILGVKVQAVSMEFARRGEDDLKLFKDVPFQVAIGVIDVKTNEVESSAFVADRIRRGLDVIGPERLIITPDCGLVRLPRDVAFSKLSAMVDGTRAIRKELGR